MMKKLFYILLMCIYGLTNAGLPCTSTASRMTVYLVHPRYHEWWSSLYIHGITNASLSCISTVSRRPVLNCCTFLLYLLLLLCILSNDCTTNVPLAFQVALHTGLLGLQEAAGTKNAPRLYSKQCCNFSNNYFLTTFQQLFNLKIQIIWNSCHEIIQQVTSHFS